MSPSRYAHPCSECSGRIDYRTGDCVRCGMNFGSPNPKYQPDFLETLRLLAVTLLSK